MNVWLFSSGSRVQNASADIDMLSSIPGESLKVAFLPTCKEDGDLYFRQLRRRLSYHSCGKNISFRFFRIFDILGEKEVSEILAADIVYLSGGNTFSLLEGLRKNGLLPKLYKRGVRGGLTAGHSAGAIVLSHDITMAAFPAYDRDENDAGIRDMKGVRLIPFEVFPHYDDQEETGKYRRSLQQYTRNKGGMLYAIADGQSIHINGSRFLTFYGGATAFCGGDAAMMLPSEDIY
mgnify:CR=1 FL=1